MLFKNHTEILKSCDKCLRLTYEWSNQWSVFNPLLDTFIWMLQLRRLITYLINIEPKKADSLIPEKFILRENTYGRLNYSRHPLKDRNRLQACYIIRNKYTARGGAIEYKP